MSETECTSLRRELRAELRLAARGRYSTEARSAIEKQGRFLLAVLDDRFVPPPAPRAKKPRLQSPKAPEENPPTGRFRTVHTYSPSPSKYRLPAYGAPASGGLPSLGKRG